MKVPRLVLWALVLLVVVSVGAYSAKATGPATAESSSAISAPMAEGEGVAGAPEGNGVCSADSESLETSLGGDIGTEGVCLQCTTNPDNCNEICESGVGRCVKSTHCCMCMIV